jgi:hypothetical protein
LLVFESIVGSVLELVLVDSLPHLVTCCESEFAVQFDHALSLHIVPRKLLTQLLSAKHVKLQILDYI